MLERINEGQQPIDHENRVHGDDKVQPRTAMGFAPEEAAKLENWFEVREIQARPNVNSLEIQGGDMVKSYKQRDVHDKEVVSDYPGDPAKVKRITKILSKTFYEVEGATHPVVRADLILHTEGESQEEPAAEDPKEEEPFTSFNRKPVRAREARNAEKSLAKAGATARAQAVKAEDKAKKKEAKNVTETINVDLLAVSMRMRERHRARFAG